MMTSVIQVVLQNFPINWNKQTSYLEIKKSKLPKENYGPISILPNVSKIYEMCMYDEIATYFEILPNEIKDSDTVQIFK